MEWTGSLTDGDDLIKGKIKIPNLSEENEPEDITVSTKLVSLHGIWVFEKNPYPPSVDKRFAPPHTHFETTIEKF